MTSQKATGNIPAAPTETTGLRLNSSYGITWARDLPPVEGSAPGDALYEALEDFVLDQSEGDESSDDGKIVEKSSDGTPEQSRAVNGDGEDKEATGVSNAGNHNDGRDTNQQTSRLLTAKPRRRKRVPYAADEEIVLYLLHHHVSIQHYTRTHIFNRLFRGQGIVREKRALIMQWSRFKDDYSKRFANLSAAERAKHEAWKKKIDKAMKKALKASHSDDKQSHDSDGANDMMSRSATSKQPRETRARYTDENEIVLHILRGRKDLNAGTRAEIFNHVFHAEGVIRNQSSLGKHWRRFKDVLQKKFDNLSPAELAEHEWWKQRVDEAIQELSR